MKKNFLIGILFLAMSFMAEDLVFAKITGSGHDFSSQSWAVNQEICLPCHTPHNAKGNTGSDKFPLWNHALTTATFTAYSSPTLNATVGQPSASSKACLSCHDGTVALNAFGGSTGSSIFAVGSLKIGTDLSSNHPVSFVYDSALATTDATLNDPTTKTVSSLAGKTIDQAMLIGRKIECGTCHDVHAAKGDSGTVSSLLVVDNSGSKLCLTCHNK